MATRRPAIRKKAKGAYHHGDLRASLKTAALRLVRARGPRGFSLNEASRLAGVSVAAPYRHFADKDALLAELACDGNRLLAAELRAATAQAAEVADKVLAAGLAYLHFAEVHADYFAVIFNAGLDKSHFAEVEQTGREAFAVILELAQSAESEPSRAELLALNAWSVVHGLAALKGDGALSAGSKDPGPDALEAVLSFFVQKMI